MHVLDDLGDIFWIVDHESQEVVPCLSYHAGHYFREIVVLDLIINVSFEEIVHQVLE